MRTPLCQVYNLPLRSLTHGGALTAFAFEYFIESGGGGLGSPPQSSPLPICSFASGTATSSASIALAGTGQGNCENIESHFRWGMSRSANQIWSGRPGSNRRHSAWEADVLPLNYSRFDSNYIAGQRDPTSRAMGADNLASIVPEIDIAHQA